MMDNYEEKIWFEKPAKNWNEALPIGNGKIGAMLYGGADVEKIALNADTFWAGYMHNKLANVTSEWRSEAFSAWENGDYLKAEHLVHQNMQGEEVDGYQPVGTLYIDYQIPQGYQYSKRSLNLMNGIHKSEFKVHNKEFVTETFASYNNDIIAIHIKCSKPHWFTVSFEGHYVKERAFGENHIIFRGQAPEISNQLAYYYPERTLHRQGNRGIWYESAVAVKTNGILKQECESLRIENATDVYIYTAIDTSYNGMRKSPDKQFRECALNKVQSALKSDYTKIRNNHIKWFSGYMGKLVLKLSKTDNSFLPTDKRLKGVQEGKKDPAFAQLYMQLGRYMLLSSSAQGMPANLQGIWNNEEKARWNSNYTLNINLPMNYWLAETGNLSFCNEPLFDFLDDARENGREAAEKYFGCKGFFMAHNSDVWGSTNPVNGYPRCIAWTTGGAWLCRHIWEQYCFGLDKDKLRKRFPIIEEAVLFLADYFIQDRCGNYKYFPSSSPENEYIQDNVKIAIDCGSTMELSIVNDLFQIYLSAQKELGIEQSILSEKCSEILENISLISRVDSDGKLMEWSRNTEEAEKGHRHLSHLYGVFPGEVFCSEQNMMSAARRSLDFRMSNGSGYTGWSAAWAQCLYAVFGDGLMAYECLQKLWESSTLPNLFDTCNDVFQIDGNLGAAAGIIEMLVQSRNGKIDILPALPEIWQNGSIYGVKLRGGGEIEIHWKDGFLTGYSITGMNNNPVYYKGKRIDEKNL